MVFTRGRVHSRLTNKPPSSQPIASNTQSSICISELRLIRKLYPPTINLYRSYQHVGHLYLPSQLCSGSSNHVKSFLTTTKDYTEKSGKMTETDLFIDLKAPNGREYKQPLGLFINNQFIKSSSGERITSINPTCDMISSDHALAPRADLHQR